MAVDFNCFPNSFHGLKYPSRTFSKLLAFGTHLSTSEQKPNPVLARQEGVPHADNFHFEKAVSASISGIPLQLCIYMGHGDL